MLLFILMYFYTFFIKEIFILFLRSNFLINFTKQMYGHTHIFFILYKLRFYYLIYYILYIADPTDVLTTLNIEFKKKKITCSF